MDNKILYGDLREYAGGDKHVARVSVLILMLGLMHYAKEKIYNLSFCRRGMVGVFMNLARKWDNIENMATKEDYFQVAFIDALFDIATYALKTIIIIAGISPQTFIKWLENVYCENVGVDIDGTFSIFDKDMEGILRSYYANTVVPDHREYDDGSCSCEGGCSWNPNKDIKDP